MELPARHGRGPGARVRFPTPIPLYVDNFIGFPVGGIVPVGEYDPTRQAWVPAPNGRVIAIVDTAGGLAAIDSDGDGQADDAAALAALGITTAERQQLALSYAPGRSLWRVAVQYVSRFDCNWPGGYPADAIAPDGGPPRGADDAHERLADAAVSADGAIVFATQTLRESAAVTGTPFEYSRVGSTIASFSTANLAGYAAASSRRTWVSSIVPRQQRP